MHRYESSSCFYYVTTMIGGHHHRQMGYVMIDGKKQLFLHEKLNIRTAGEKGS